MAVDESHGADADLERRRITGMTGYAITRGMLLGILGVLVSAFPATSYAFSFQPQRVAEEQVFVPSASAGDTACRQGLTKIAQLFPAAPVETNRRRPPPFAAPQLRGPTTAKPVAPCEGGVFIRIVATTSECVNHRVVLVNTVEWWCPPGRYETSIWREQTESAC